MTMQAHHEVSASELHRAAQSPFWIAFAICGLLATAVLGGFAWAQSGRSGQGANPMASAPSPFAGDPARPSARVPGGPSPLGYLVYDWEGPIPTFDDN